MGLIFFPGFMNGELDTDALHAAMPASDTKWVSQVLDPPQGCRALWHATPHLHRPIPARLCCSL